MIGIRMFRGQTEAKQSRHIGSDIRQVIEGIGPNGDGIAYNGNDQFKDDHQDVAEDRKQRKNNAIGFSDFFIFGILMILDQGLAQPFKHYPYYSSKNV